MMLHTDVFNSNNKNKMTKADYVKNTRLEGVPQIVLEVGYSVVSMAAVSQAGNADIDKFARHFSTMSLLLHSFS